MNTRIKDKRKKTGEGRYPEWDYFDPIDAVLGHRPATEPAVVIDTLKNNEPLGPDSDTLDDTGTTSGVYEANEDEEVSERTLAPPVAVQKKQKRT